VRVVRRAGAIAAGWVVLVAFFVVSTTAMDALPDERIAGTLVSANAAGQWDVDSTTNGFGLPLDRYTECVAFTQGLGSDADRPGSVQSALSDLYLAPEGCAGVMERIEAVAAGGSAAVTPYFRYWHGYVLLTRPLLTYTAIPTLRLTVAALLVGALAWLLVGLSRTLGPWSAVAFLPPLLLGSDLTALPESATHAISWTVILACSGAGFWLARRGPWAIAAWALYSGSVFVFVDFLTNPPGALVVLLLAVLAVGVAGSWGPGVLAWRTALAGGMWFLGYAGTWVAKWVLSAAVLGFDAVRANVVGMVEFRLSGAHEEVSQQFGAAIGKNLSTWLTMAGSVKAVVACCLVVCAVSLAVIAWRRASDLLYVGLFLVVAALPFAWYVVLSNHSQIHAWFTYRSLPASLAVLTAGVVGLVVRRGADDRIGDGWPPSAGTVQLNASRDVPLGRPGGGQG